MTPTLVLIKGGGDLGSAAAFRLHKSGFKVVMTEVQTPLVVRRTVSYAQAVIQGQAVVEGVRAVRVRTLKALEAAMTQGQLPVMVDPGLTLVKHLHPFAVIDATMAKRNRGMTMDLAPFTLALGPGFTAGKDVHAVVETKRGHYLGRVIRDGRAIPNTGIPGKVMGYGEERVLRAPCTGRVVHCQEIGSFVAKGRTICRVGRIPVKSPFEGVIRGLIMEGATVKKGLKIGDVDPRGKREYCFTFSDKALSVAGGVLEALLHELSVQRGNIREAASY